MDWNNLKNNQCPKCGVQLTQNARFCKCINVDCDFSCSVRKFNQIVAQLYYPSYSRTIRDDTENNLSGLNNL